MPQKPKSSKPQGKGFKIKAVAEESVATSTETTPAREAFENLGDLPHGYGVDTIFLVAQEPHWLFTYWDIDIAKHPGGAAILRYHNTSGLEGEIEVPFETRNWYVPVQQAAMDYYVEIGFYRGKTWNAIARSVTATTPPEGMATAETFDYATIPFHLSFQRLLDNLESASQSGEDLLSAVARLQQNGDFSAFGGIGFQDLLSEDQRALLNILLGPELATNLSSGAFSSGEIESRIRAFIEEHLSSGGGSSEFLSSFTGLSELLSSGAFSSGALTSALLASGAFSSGAFSSSGFTGAGAFSSGMLASSWTESGLSLSSWVASLGGSWTESAFASWVQAALTSWGQVTTSSWSVGGETSWSTGGESSGSLAAMSSWLQGIQSSWAEAALTSWSSAEVSSWFSATETSSWGGSSETLSSFGAGASGEVILHGGTDPSAKITINGQPITLNPDGSFRFPFVLSNKTIDIVAE